MMRTGLADKFSPTIYRIGQLLDGRNLYRALTVFGPAYCATDEIVTHWDQGSWWTPDQEEVRQWLLQAHRRD